jgi:hypothetical protein
LPPPAAPPLPPPMPPPMPPPYGGKGGLQPPAGRRPGPHAAMGGEWAPGMPPGMPPNNMAPNMPQHNPNVGGYSSPPDPSALGESATREQAHMHGRGRVRVRVGVGAGACSNSSVPRNVCRGK